MFREVPQAGGGGAVRLEDGLVAEEDGDCDCDADGEERVARSRGAMRLESPPNGVRGLQAWWFGGAGGRPSVWGLTGRAHGIGGSYAPTQRVEEVPDHRSRSTDMPGLQL